MSSQHGNVSLAATLLGVASALLLMLAVGIVLQGWAARWIEVEEQRKVIDRTYPELEAYRLEQEEALVGYHWIDQETGQVHLPIERAMEVVAQEYAEAAK